MKIVFKGLSFFAVIGIEILRERTLRGWTINATIEYKPKDGNFLDYKEIKKIIKKRVKKREFYLLEDAAGSIAGSPKEEIPHNFIC